MNKLRNLVWRGLAIWKRFLSRFKNEWTIEDYPIRFQCQSVSGAIPASRLETHDWKASVIGWPAMTGCGHSKLDALEDLRKAFDQLPVTWKKPRPGTGVQVEFAETDRIDRYPGLADDFVQRVLEHKWAWISNESSLWDFHVEETNDRLNNRIRQIYGVDVSDIPSGNLAEIFERISQSRVTNGNFN